MTISFLWVGETPQSITECLALESWPYKGLKRQLKQKSMSSFCLYQMIRCVTTFRKSFINFIHCRQGCSDPYATCNIFLEYNKSKNIWKSNVFELLCPSISNFLELPPRSRSSPITLSGFKKTHNLLLFEVFRLQWFENLYLTTQICGLWQKSSFCDLFLLWRAMKWFLQKNCFIVAETEIINIVSNIVIGTKGYVSMKLRHN